MECYSNKKATEMDSVAKIMIPRKEGTDDINLANYIGFVNFLSGRRGAYMAFSSSVVLDAWKRAGGKCERCNKQLALEIRGRESQGSREAHHKTIVKTPNLVSKPPYTRVDRRFYEAQSA
jgi:hypothetical protein